MKPILFLFLPVVMIIIGFLWQVRKPQSHTILVALLKERIVKKQVSLETFFEMLGRRWIWQGLALAMVGISLLINTRGSSLKEIVLILIFNLGLNLMAIIITLLVSIFE